MWDTQIHPDGGATYRFGPLARVECEARDLMVLRTQDAIGNDVSVKNDYRTLQPCEMTDPNGNRVEVSIDALGLVVATAVKGKVTEALRCVTTNLGQFATAISHRLSVLRSDPWAD